MNSDTGEIKTSEEMRKMFWPKGVSKDIELPKRWTQFGLGDIVALHNLAGKRIGWFEVQLVTKKQVSLRPISEREAEDVAKTEGLA